MPFNKAKGERNIAKRSGITNAAYQEVPCVRQRGDGLIYALGLFELLNDPLCFFIIPV